MMGTRRTTAARMMRTERRPSRAVSLMRTVAGILGSEECEDGEDSAIVRGVGGEAELREHRADVLLNGSGAEVEDSGDRGVGLALGHELEDFEFTGAQGRQPVLLPGPDEDLGHDLGVEHGAAAGDLVDGVEEVLDIGDSVLEQVAEAAGVLGDELGGVLLLHVLAEHEALDVEVLLAAEDRCADALIGECRGHALDDDAQIRGIVVHRGQQLVGRGYAGADRGPGIGQEPLESGTQTGRVFSDYDAHGTSTTTVVGPPEGLVRFSVPRAASTRSMSPAMPVCRPVRSTRAPPWPLSVTTIWTPVSLGAVKTLARVAPECLAMFVRHSATTK